MKKIFWLFSLLLACFPFSADCFLLQSGKSAFSYDMMVRGNNPANESAKQTDQNKQSQTQTQNQSENLPQKKQTQQPSFNHLYNQEYAAKLFKTYSGTIKLSYPNIPTLINVQKNTNIEIFLPEENNAFWNIDISKDNIAKVYDKKNSNNQRKIVLKANDLGKCVIMLDYISNNNNQYKVLKTQKLILNVSKK